MAKVDLSDYKNLYLETAREYIDKMSVSLDKLSDNASDKDALNDLHISSHSLLGQSQVMGFSKIVDICLKIEKMSSDVLKTGNQINNNLINVLKESVEKLNLFLSQIER